MKGNCPIPRGITPGSTSARRLSDHGVTYRSVIDRLRFRVARELLLNPDLRTIDVAREVGFNDPGNFSRMFRRVAGLSPPEYRRAAV